LNYKVYIYVIMTITAAFGLSGINFSKFMKKDSYFESRVLVIVLSMALGYLASKFIITFLNL